MTKTAFSVRASTMPAERVQLSSAVAHHFV